MTPVQRMISGLVPGVPYHGREDIQRLQDAAGRRSLVIDAAAASCTKLDAATFQGWRLTGYVPAQQFVQQDVPLAINVVALNAMWEQGQATLANLESWATKLNAAGCNVPIAARPSAWGETLTAAKWIGGTVAVVAVAAVIVKALNLAEDVTR